MYRLPEILCSTFQFSVALLISLASLLWVKFTYIICVEIFHLKLNFHISDFFLLIMALITHHIRRECRSG